MNREGFDANGEDSPRYIILLTVCIFFLKLIFLIFLLLGPGLALTRPDPTLLAPGLADPRPGPAEGGPALEGQGQGQPKSAWPWPSPAPGQCMSVWFSPQLFIKWHPHVQASWM